LFGSSLAPFPTPIDAHPRPSSLILFSLGLMIITSRYGDQVPIDPERVPVEFRHLLSLAKEWSIGDDVELDGYIDSARGGSSCSR
jgi:hypothetical protein